MFFTSHSTLSRSRRAFWALAWSFCFSCAMGTASLGVWVITFSLSKFFILLYTGERPPSRVGDGGWSRSLVSYLAVGTAPA